MTRMPLALKLAWRYLAAPKSHGAVNAISIISIAGVAVATAAIVIVLSVFNGFRYHLNVRLDNLTPDVAVTPASGKTFADADSLTSLIADMAGVEMAMAAVADNALAIANGKEMPVRLYGVSPELFSRITHLDSLLIDGVPLSPAPEEEENKAASISVGVAQRMGIYQSGEPLLIFTPKRSGRINTANLAGSFLSDSLDVSSIFRSQQVEFDDNTIICDISVARNLFDYDTEATSIEIKALPGTDPSALATSIRKELGDDFIVKDRLQQQELNFRMVEVEKWITFLLLAFILIIASFNIVSTLAMLIVEKGRSIVTLSHIGMSRKRIGAVFWWESVLVTIFGAASGLIIGLILSLLQEKFGLIKLSGDPSALIISSYPVKVEWLDLAITCVPIIAIGLITAFISRSFAMSRARS